MSQSQYKESQQSPYQTLTFHQLQHFRGQKEESLKFLQRRFVYNMKLVAKKKKEKVQFMEQLRKKQQQQNHKRTFSQYFDKLKKQNDKLITHKKTVLKQSVEIHRQQKSENMLSLKRQIINAANFHRFERDLYHNQINREKQQTFRHKRKLYHRQRMSQTFRKNRQQQRISQSKRAIHSEKKKRFKTQCDKIQQIEQELKSQRQQFEWGLKKAVNQYNRLSMN